MALRWIIRLLRVQEGGKQFRSANLPYFLGKTDLGYFAQCVLYCIRARLNRYGLVFSKKSKGWNLSVFGPEFSNDENSNLWIPSSSHAKTAKAKEIRQIPLIGLDFQCFRPWISTLTTRMSNSNQKHEI